MAFESAVALRSDGRQERRVLIQVQGMPFSFVVFRGARG